MTNNIDPNTGLPELPKGFFWRIKASNLEAYGGSPLVLEIRERVFLFFSERVEYGFTTEANLAADAKILAVEFYYRRDRSAYRKELLGDYPPKKLVIND